MSDVISHFEKRKSDHLKIALLTKTQATGMSGLDFVFLEHNAFPEINFTEINLKTILFGKELSVPFFISSMTAGHENGFTVNQTLARFAEKNNILMGVGSQRRELFDPLATNEWKLIRKTAPNVRLVGNIGMSQLIAASVSDVEKIVDSLQAEALFVHTNPLQEVLQKEGTPEFKGGLQAIGKMCKALKVPIIVKEVGCGFSKENLLRLAETGVHAVDVSGLGGTHWGRVEGYRQEDSDKFHQAALAFQNWGNSTVDCLLAARELKVENKLPYQVWASGGIRSGLDVAKCIAMGASMIGIAQPWIKALLGADLKLASNSEFKLQELFERIEYELKIALFCSGVKTPLELLQKGNWKWQK